MGGLQHPGRGEGKGEEEEEKGEEGRGGKGRREGGERGGGGGEEERGEEERRREERRRGEEEGKWARREEDMGKTGEGGDVYCKLVHYSELGIVMLASKPDFLFQV